MLRDKIRDLERFDQVLRILVENEMGYLIEKSGITDQIPFRKRIKTKRHDKPGPERLRETIEELGSIYVKFGQILGQRPDLIPTEYTEELEKLEDSVPQFEWSKAEKIIEEEVGKDEFEDIDEEPIAAASLSQVHRATLKNGEDVVIKVRRPGIREKIEKDLQILESISRRAEKHSNLAEESDVLQFVQQFSEWTRKELDFEQEGMNAQIFRENLSNEEKVKVPRVYPELNTEKVLVMEYVEGVKCTNTEKMQELDIKTEEIAETAVRAGIRQSIIDGFFHADPHPSNFLITENSEIIYLDFGMMGKVSQKTGEKLGLLLIYLIREDIDGILDCLEDLGKQKDRYSRDKVEDVVEEKVLILKNTSLKQTSITREMFDLFVQISDHGLQMPSNMALMGKNLVTMEGIALTIYPDFQIQDNYEELVEEALKEENSPQDMAEDFTADLIKNKDLITKLPTKINKKLEEKPGGGDISVEISGRRGSNFAAAMIVSSSLLIAVSPLFPPLLVLGAAEFAMGLYFHRRQNLD